MTTNPLMQHIEAIAKEKGIEPQVIVTALEDAMLTASRKHYKTTENLRTRLNPETGNIELYAVKHIVQDVTNPATEISLARRRSSTAKKPRSTWRSSSPSRPKASDASRRRR